MSLPIDREFVTQVVIVLSACFGGWMIFVQPKADAMQEIQTAIAQHKEDIKAKNNLAVESIARRAPALRDRSREIDAMNALAGDSSLLYGRVMSLAKEYGVQVKNMRPGVERRLGRDDLIIVVRIDITVEGEYEHMARFLDALNDIETHLRQTSVQISPTKRPDGEYSIMQLGFEALRFTLPKAVAQMKDAAQ